jgi:hypothetical protein
MIGLAGKSVVLENYELKNFIAHYRSIISKLIFIC